MRTGDIVRIEFDDHSEGMERQSFVVYGVVIRLSRQQVTLNSFTYSRDVMEHDDNTWTLTVDRRTISKVGVLGKEV